MYRFNILEQILLYIESAHRRLFLGSFIQGIPIFFNLKGRSFLIACYILYPGLYLENKGNHQIYKKNHFQRKRDPVAIIAI